jgi:hypothetical protein
MQPDFKRIGVYSTGHFCGSLGEALHITRSDNLLEVLEPRFFKVKIKDRPG